MPHLSGLEWEGEPLEPPSKLPWYVRAELTGIGLLV